jgi:hypothetical protein
MRAAAPLLLLLLGGVAAGPPLAAQTECADAGYGGSGAQVCQTFVDAVRTFHPLAGMIVSGGNPVLGTAQTLGGFGHAVVSARLNAIRISVPNPDSAGRSSVPSSFDGLVPAPVVEAALGLLRGARTGLLSLDLLGSATLLPTGRVRGLTVDPGAPRLGGVALGMGYGARLGLFRGGFAVPAVSLSVMRRHLPRLQYGDVTAGDSAQFATDLNATNIRAVASLRFVLLDVAAGVGWDRYTSSAEVAFLDPSRPLTNPQRIPLALRSTREVLFVDAGLDLQTATLVGELGFQTGKDQHLSTNFTDFDPTAGHVFGGVGLRFSF